MIKRFLALLLSTLTLITGCSTPPSHPNRVMPNYCRHLLTRIHSTPAYLPRDYKTKNFLKKTNDIAIYHHLGCDKYERISF